MNKTKPGPSNSPQRVATAEDIRRTFGPLDDVVITPLLDVGATPVEVAEAEAWLNNNLVCKTLAYGRTSRIAMLVEILRDSDWIAGER